MKEKWKAVLGFEGYYEISTLGRVKSLPRNGTINKAKILSPDKVNGYLQIQLNKSGFKRRVKVHRLVAEAFIPNTENKLQVNHIDLDRANNDVSNLEWVTASENINHSYAKGRKAKEMADHSQSKIDYTQAITIISCLREGMPYTKLASYFGLSKGTIMDLSRGHHWVYRYDKSLVVPRKSHSWRSINFMKNLPNII